MSRRDNPRTDLNRTNLERDDLRGQVDRLRMITQAMWEMMRDMLNVGDGQLVEWVALVETIDLRDGKKDGKSTPVPPLCVGCKKLVSARMHVCICCGLKADTTSPFNKK